MNSMRKLESVDQLNTLQIQRKAKIDAYEVTITACAGTGCSVSDSVAVCDALQDEIERQDVADRVRLRRTGCHGF